MEVMIITGPRTVNDDDDVEPNNSRFESEHIKLPKHIMDVLSIN